jgi:AraC family transcriptional regulator of adaptative response / DNA-3-methyladenine glycosylase II
MATEVSLAFRSPFDADGVLSFLRERSIDGVEEVIDGSYRRSVWTSRGPVVVRLTPRDDEVRLDVQAEHDVAPDLDGIVAAAKDAFDLDADPDAVDETLGRDEVLAPLVEARPGIRLPGTFNRFELVLRALFGQQVSVAGARTSLARFVSRFGTRLERPVRTVTHLFPSAEQVAEIDPETLGMPRGRARAIRRIGELAEAGELDLSAHAGREATMGTLAEVPGIGPWTLAYIAMRGLRDPDSFPVSDLGVRRGFERIGLSSSPTEIVERAERWRPWRAYAVMHLWQNHR